MIHKNKRDQLLSIKGVSDNYSGRQYLQNLLSILFRDTGYALVFVRRNNYQDNCIERLRNEAQNLGINNLKIADNLFEISFSFAKIDSENEIISILADLWHSFEQPVYCFFKSREELETKFESILKGKMWWKEIASLLNGYVVYRDMEYDVVWVGKSEELDFDIV